MSFGGCEPLRSKVLQLGPDAGGSDICGEGAGASGAGPSSKKRAISLECIVTRTRSARSAAADAAAAATAAAAAADEDDDDVVSRKAPADVAAEEELFSGKLRVFASL